MSAQNPSVWVLTDDRAGHNAQSKGLAHHLGMFYSMKPIEYRPLASLPNFFIGHSLKGIRTQSRKQIAPPWPKLVIAAGRRTVPIVEYIKEHAPEVALVQLMWPGKIDPFDLVIVPEHDNPPDDPRVIATKGALHTITHAQIEQEARLLEDRYVDYASPRIALMIGGKSKHGKFEKQDYQTLIDLAELLAGPKGSLLISSSRRTPNFVQSLCADRLTIPHHYYHFASGEPNPYPGLLGLADAIIVTGDSISMAAEACYTGKPVYLYNPRQFDSAKISHFQQQLFDGNHAYRLNANSDWKNAEPTPLDEMSRVVEIVKQKLSEKTA
ncbi:MAG: mitochondrial fission ELM1 family protein [Rickettsiales bacterium]|nr:mitochondrial fission ELM1 family protein [Rickettsiales bacterium]